MAEINEKTVPVLPYMVKVGDEVMINSERVKVTHNEMVSHTVPQIRFIKGLRADGKGVYWEYSTAETKQFEKIIGVNLRTELANY